MHVLKHKKCTMYIGVQWLSGKVLYLRSRGRDFPRPDLGPNMDTLPIQI